MRSLSIHQSSVERLVKSNYLKRALWFTFHGGDEFHVARGAAVLRAGDWVTIVSNDYCMPLARQRLIGAEEEED